MEEEKLHQAARARLEQLYDRRKERRWPSLQQRRSCQRKEKRKPSREPYLFFLKVAFFLVVVALGVFLGKPYLRRFFPHSSTIVDKPANIPGFKYLRTRCYSCAGISHEVPEYLHEQTGLEFALLPGGHFFMGSKCGEAAERPLHEVTLKPFLISKVEVTQSVWQKIMGAPWFFAFRGRICC